MMSWEDEATLPAEPDGRPPARLKRRSPGGWRDASKRARQVYAAVDGWQGMSTPTDWVRACKKAERVRGQLEPRHVRRAARDPHAHADPGGPDRRPGPAGGLPDPDGHAAGGLCGNAAALGC
jgi:hypothetical protein